MMFSLLGVICSLYILWCAVLSTLTEEEATMREVLELFLRALVSWGRGLGFSLLLAWRVSDLRFIIIFKYYVNLRQLMRR